MKKPPVSLCYPTYVVEYAKVDDTVEFMNRGNLNVGGEWLGAVPKLAICKDIKSNEFFLAHCDSDWQMLCMVENHATIEETKANAEKHYKGISKRWIKTNYKKKKAKQLFDKVKEKMKCSFCGKSHYDDKFSSLICGKNANICNVCVDSISKEFSVNDGS